MRENKHFLPKQCCLLLLLAAAFSHLAAQNPRVESLTIADGLSQGMIYDIEQTGDGFLWFATKDGLNRYDGYRFEVFTNDPFNPFSIAGNDIHQMFEDSRGNLWLVIGGNEVDMLEKTSGRFLHLPANAVQGGASGFGNVVETHDGAIWIGSNNGLLRLRWKNSGMADTDNPDLGASMSVELASRGKLSGKSFFHSITANPDGSLIVSILNDGIYKFTPADGRLTSLFATPKGWSFLWESTPGRVWTAIGNQAFMVENGGSPREISFSAIPPGFSLNRIFSDGRGNLIWVAGSIEGGSYFFSAPEEQLLRNGSAGQPLLIYKTEFYSPWSQVDRSGNLWVGTSGYGLQKINLSPPSFQHFLAGKSLWQIFTGEEIYLNYGSANSLFKFDEVSNSLQLPQTMPPLSFLYNLCQTRSGDTWFLGARTDNQTFLGVKSNSKLTLKKIPEPHCPYCPLIEDSKGRLWTCSTAGRLLCIEPSTQNTAYFDFSEKLDISALVHALYEDAQQNLWVGTTNGVLKLEIGKLDIEILTDSTISNIPISQYQTISTNPRSLRHNFATSFCADPLDPERYLWVSTKGGGLNLLDMTTGEFQHFTSQNSGLPNDVVYGILPDDLGNLWCSTNRGLSRLTVGGESTPPTANSQQPTAQRTYRFRNFREFDGLQSDEFNTASFAKGKDGRLFFGGVKGLTAFYPSEIKDRQSDAPVRITGLKINNLPVDFLQKDGPLDRPIHRTERLRLDHTQNLVTLEFALMDFVLPKENRYRYRLQGVDPGWVEAGTSHVANYARLHPGDYLFEVQGSIGGGDWSAPATLRITVLPPWWATWWAFALYFLALGGALYLFYKNRLRQKLEHQESLRLRELDEFKSRFFTNITHEFRTPLTVILGMAERLKKELLPSVLPSDRVTSSHPVTNAVNLIKRNGESLLRLINQILDLAKLESKSLKINYVQGDVLPYLRYVAESLQSLANAQNVLLRVESDQAKIEMDYDPERLLQITYNLISNAIKFTPGGGRVTMKLEIGNWEIGKLSGSPISNFQFPVSNFQFLISVTDTGVGIPPEDLPKIFDRFYQVDSAVSTSSANSTGAGGTGIGLSLTKELVKAMGGEISVKSEVGKGTTFTVRLPITNKAAASDGVTSSHAVTLAAPENLGGNLKLPPKLTDANHLLLIEDNPDVVEYLAACLGESYQLDFAYNGRAGIEKALETIPDLIISDVMMPEKDGFEVCDFLKNDERTSHIPIVLLTAKADVESRIAGLKRGADAYLAKPFHQEELMVTLANLLELRHKLQVKYATVTAASAAEPEPAPAAKAAGTKDLEDAFLKKLSLCIGENLGDTAFDGGRLAKAVNLSEVQLYRKIKALTDKSTAIFIRSIRLQKGRELLQTTSLNVSEIAYEVGFDDPNYFSRTFSQEFGAAPSEVRK